LDAAEIVVLIIPNPGIINI